MGGFVGKQNQASFFQHEIPAKHYKQKKVWPKDPSINALISDTENLQCKIQMPNLWCPSKKQIVNVCTNAECKQSSSLYCQSETCKPCRAHHGCHNIRLRTLTKLFQKKTEDQRSFLFSLLQVEEQMISYVKGFRRELIQLYKWPKMEDSYHKIIQNIFVKGKNYEVKSAIVKQFADLMKEKPQQDNLKYNFLKTFETETQKIANYLNFLKYKFMNDLSELKQTYFHPKINSKIISPEMNSFIETSLNYPKDIQLLFRASEHDFRATAFHQYCDDIPHTFTIIKTSFGKTVAGYTPLKWVAAGGKWLPDYSKSTFLLSIDLKKKMNLMQPDTAICCNSKYGPTFGGGADLYISDKCNTNINSHARFPTSFNCSGSVYQKNQESFNAFSGAKNNQYFSVIEYEVFRVIW